MVYNVLTDQSYLDVKRNTSSDEKSRARASGANGDNKFNVSNFTIIAVLVEGKWKCSDCKIQYKAVGCYKDDGQRPLPLEILNERDETSKVYGGRMIDWYDWDNYMAGFACRCAAKAKSLGYTVFGLQFFGKLFTQLTCF